jgi:hypothetical protein
VGDCSFSAFGNVSSCLNHDDDNNGLWTSLVVAAESFRYAVTKDPNAKSEAVHFFNGMKMLNTITNIKGERLKVRKTWRRAILPSELKIYIYIYIYCSAPFR